MTDADIKFIEQELGIALPESYQRAVVPFRIPALSGNTDYQLWDDAKRLVELNRKLRAGSRMRPAWMPHLFAVGDPHGDEMIAMDIRSADAPVWWLDHGLVDSEASYQSHSNFADWAEEFYRDMRSDLEGDGIDPDGKAKANEPVTGWGVLGYFLSLVGIAVLGLVVLLVFFGSEHFQKYRSHSETNKNEAVFLGFDVVSAQSQGPLEPAPSPKPRQNAKNPRSEWLQYFFKRFRSWLKRH